jgi:hypothetical protein
MIVIPVRLNLRERRPERPQRANTPPSMGPMSTPVTRAAS